MQTSLVQRGGLRAVKVDVVISDPLTERSLEQILSILQASALPEPIVQRAASIFSRLGAVEANIHGVQLHEVHLHELGGLDTIVDVLGTLLGLEQLGIQEIYCSAIPLGRGITRSQHGPLPLPSPATLALLDRVPVVGRDIDKELVTPTGAVLLTSLVKSFGPIPAMQLEKTGYGAGSTELDIPNVLRLLVGEKENFSQGQIETLVMLETNIDDLNPEFYDYLFERLFEQGALDVALVPLHMKKNRPATQVQVLCPPSEAEKLSEVLFTETSTLGIRKQYLERIALEREVIQVETPYGIIRVKVARLAGDHYKLAPEFEDCRRVASQHNQPLREVYRLAVQLAQERFNKP
ncbi:MAG: nickel pincer cofactor biosynthesis protein LarC [Anaerolineales bacterium]